MNRTKTPTGTCWCMRGHGDEPRRIPITDDLESFGDERIRRLVATTGHVGPWCDREFVEAGLQVTVWPSRPEPPPEPDWLVEARRAAEEALRAFKQADDAWEAAAKARRRYADKLANAPTVIDGRSGAVIPGDPSKREKLDELKQAARDAWQHREDMAVPLHRARAAHNAAASRWGQTVRDRERKLARGDT